MSPTYDRQDRGSAAGYAAYFAGMNKSMQQKVALTTAHFPPSGTLADMGSGSGQATLDLAALYPGLSVVGVDISPAAVAISTQTHRRDNLRYVVGDVADPIFPDGHLDGILDSSVLHHVTSFNGFSLARVEALMDHQCAQLRTGGVLIIRDFVVPDGPEEAVLALPTTDGQDDGPVPALSTAALFRRFARDFRSSRNRDGPVPYETLPPRRPGWRSYRLALRAAAEFVLRKDYRQDWDVELLEEYTYWSQADFERAFSARGLRVVVSCPLYNWWVVENRYRGRFALEDADGRPLPFPPTNFLVVGEKAPPGAGVALREASSATVERPAFLRLERHRHVATGRLFDLVHRPQRTLDVLPWFDVDTRLFVLARHGFPRPIVNVRGAGRDLVGHHGAGYITEPIAAIVDGEQPPRAAVERVLAERAGITPADIHDVTGPFAYFTSPGGLNERVDACLVRVAPWREQRPITNYAPFSSSGDVRFLDATQALRACHVGGMFDARLELNIYRLCLSLGRAVGPWIGAEPAVLPAEHPRASVPAADVVRVPDQRAFQRVEDGPPGFLDVRQGTFEETDAAGGVLHTAQFEYVVPRALSHNTLSALPVMRVDAGWLVGLELRDLPAVQAFEGSSAVLTVPACRLPRHVVDLDGAEAHAVRQFTGEFGLRIRRLFALGGRYHPSTGVTPEVVYPYLADVASQEDGARPLAWVRLDDVIAHIGGLRDAHLLVSLLRTAHATGVLRTA
ncbi:MAG: methyltransferase domain-containing protein [Deltaproteobacteria bacterium]|nr:methyltransferase domain-containing protein [Deltaproteobacteria bacterium]